MIKELVARSRSINWNRVFSVLLMVVVLLAAFPPMASAPDVTPRAQPILLQMVNERPDETVSVIVQKLVKDTSPSLRQGSGHSVEDLVARMGGVVTKDLHIINAFAAELPLKAVPKLARTDGVRWVSLDAPVVQAGKPGGCQECIDTSNLLSYYVQAIEADQLWNESPYLQGQGITVAVVDSGVALHDDLNETAERKSDTRIVASYKGPVDGYGHGTHVAGIIGGNGTRSDGGYIGVAARVSLVNVKVTDSRGGGSTSDVVAGLQWVYDHKDEYNIRVVNISLNSSVAESYHTSPLDAALEVLWFNRMVVVVSAGNNATNGYLYPPANDPFVITVGAVDDQGTADTGDDVLASFSAYGTTESGFSKPDLVAPGTNIISLLAKKNCVLYKQHPDHRVGGAANGRDYYFRMSGTSMASAVTAGAVALLLQDEPDLTPDQVKHRLMAMAQPFNGTEPGSTGAGYLDIYAAVHGITTGSANTGIEASQLLWTGSDPVNWDSVNWDSVTWDSVSLSSVNWD
jgi:serine protease AprX